MRGEANENECCLNLKMKRGQRTVESVEDLNGKQFNGFCGCRKPIWSIPLAGLLWSMRLMATTLHFYAKCNKIV